MLHSSDEVYGCNIKKITVCWCVWTLYVWWKQRHENRLKMSYDWSTFLLDVAICHKGTQVTAEHNEYSKQTCYRNGPEEAIYTTSPGKQKIVQIIVAAYQATVDCVPEMSSPLYSIERTILQLNFFPQGKHTEAKQNDFL